MFFRAKRALRRAVFNRETRAILKAAPLRTTSPDLTLVSMICHGEVSMYLLALRSFCRRLGSTPRVVILNDGSLTGTDVAALQAHVPDARLQSIAEVIPADRCPKGGCWERLLLISDLVEDSYVLQLDADTLTLADIPEILEAIAQNRSFTLLGDRSWPQIESMTEAWERYRRNADPKVQAVCERCFDQVAERDSLLYLRGNAGFTGFARGSISRERIVWFSDRMRAIAGGTWDEWGSVHLVSNLLIANSPGAVALPFPRYASYWAHPGVAYEDAAFLHFIGPHRFSNGVYRKLARRVLAAG